MGGLGAISPPRAPGGDQPGGGVGGKGVRVSARADLTPSVLEGTHRGGGAAAAAPAVGADARDGTPGGRDTRAGPNVTVTFPRLNAGDAQTTPAAPRDVGVWRACPSPLYGEASDEAPLKRPYPDSIAAGTGMCQCGAPFVPRLKAGDEWPFSVTAHPLPAACTSAHARVRCPKRRANQPRRWTASVAAGAAALAAASEAATPAAEEAAGSGSRSARKPGTAGS